MTTVRFKWAERPSESRLLLGSFMIVESLTALNSVTGYDLNMSLLKLSVSLAKDYRLYSETFLRSSQEKPDWSKIEWDINRSIPVLFMKIVMDKHGAVDSSRFFQRILTFTVGTAASIDGQIGHNAKVVARSKKRQKRPGFRWFPINWKLPKLSQGP